MTITCGGWFGGWWWWWERGLVVTDGHTRVGKEGSRKKPGSKQNGRHTQAYVRKEEGRTSRSQKRAYRELGEGHVVVVEGAEEKDVLARHHVVRLEAAHLMKWLNREGRGEGNWDGGDVSFFPSFLPSLPRCCRCRPETCPSAWGGSESCGWRWWRGWGWDGRGWVRWGSRHCWWWWKQKLLLLLLPNPPRSIQSNPIQTNSVDRLSLTVAD